MPLVNMTEMLRNASGGGYAVVSFDVFNVEMTKGVMDAAEKYKSPVIIAYGPPFKPLIPISQFAAYVRQAAKEAAVETALILDHAVLIDDVARALDCGFTAIMADASDKPLKDNIAMTLQAKKLCEKYGASLESEIGHVPGLEADYDPASPDDFSIYTEVMEAKHFVEETGVDALAVSIGTAHGIYRKEPRLNFERLAELREALDVPLVLHGASGLCGDDLRRCVEGGIAKINIYTDLAAAAAKCVNEGIGDEAGYLKKCIEVASAVSGVAENLITICGSAGKAPA